MSPVDRFLDVVTERNVSVVVIVLLLSGVFLYGMTGIEEEPGLDQFEFETEESDALEYITDNFEDGQNTTTVQIVLKEQDNALSRDVLIETLALQQELRDDPEINDTLAEEPFGDLASIVATTAIAQERSANLSERRADLEADRDDLVADREALEATAQGLVAGLNETRDLQREYAELNGSLQRGEISQSEYEANASRIEDELRAVREEAVEPLDDSQRVAYDDLLSEARAIEREFVDVEAQFQAGEISEEERDQRHEELSSELEEVYAGVEDDVLAGEREELERRGDRLEERGTELEADAEALAALDPTIQEQIETLEGMNDSEVESVVDDVVGEDADRRTLIFLPMDYELGSGETDARTLFVTQETDAEEMVEGDAPDRIVDSQLAIADAVDDRFGEDAFAFGLGILTDEIQRSQDDSLMLVLPFAFLFVLVVLSIAYRDPLDILLGLLGIVLVLVWTFGFLGWTGIVFNQVMIAVPVLLVGLSIDYAIHVFMRHREQRADDAGRSRSAMRIVFSGLGIALVLVTVTAMIGFLANLVNPVQPIQEFGIVSAFGILSTLVVFATFVPAAKVGLDEALEARGWDRTRRAFGTGGGAFTRFLSAGRAAAQRSTIAVLLVVLVVTGAGVAGATQVDTTFEQEDFIADEPPAWMDSLPGVLAPGEYSAKANLEFVNERFLRQDATTQVLLPWPTDEGDITREDTLERIHDARAVADEQEAIVRLSDGEQDLQTPLSVMETVAAENETFNETFTAADTTGNGVPDENVTAVYDALFAADEDRASRVLYRTDAGEYEAARILVSIRGDATASEARDATEAIADDLDRDDGPTAIATGQLVVFSIIEEELFNAVVDGLVVTLIAVFAFLMLAYRVTRDSALLGAVTLLPIVLTVAWILGTMYLLGIPFNVLTGTITSLTIGLGVAYNIHMSERYQLELDRGHDIWEAMERAVTGTGGALLGSAATTAGGFGVLVFAILPPLRQFGLITGITIIYAFLASVFVLPSLLVLWTEYVSPRARVTDAENDEDPELTVPERTIEPAFVEPGGSPSVRIRVPDIEGRAVVGDASPLQSVRIEHVDPEPVDAKVVNDRVYVQWSTDESTLGTVEYTGQVPSDVDPGVLQFDGEVAIFGGKRTIEGAEGIEVVPDVFERIVAAGDVSDRELRAAGNALEGDQITEMQYRRILSRWLEDGQPTPLPSGEDGSAEEESGDSERAEVRD